MRFQATILIGDIRTLPATKQNSDCQVVVGYSCTSKLAECCRYRCQGHVHH